jgi:hypothetical protein
MNLLYYLTYSQIINFMRTNSYLLVVIFLLVVQNSVFGQVKIGDNPTVVQSGSLLELESLTKGLRLPRIPLNNLNGWGLDGTPVSGMLICNDTGSVPKGIYYWNTDSTQWVRVVNAAELASLIKQNTTVSNSTSGDTLITTVNGVAAAGVPIVNSDSLLVTNGVLISKVNGVASSGVPVLTSANNGLTTINGNVQLGGALNTPTTITTSSTDTLSITGLQEGNTATDSLLTVAAGSGTIRKIGTGSLGVNMTNITSVATNGQTTFATPVVITDVKKILVYHNGVIINFSQVDANHIQVESSAMCSANDEIKIVQYF